MKMVASGVLNVEQVMYSNRSRKMTKKEIKALVQELIEEALTDVTIVCEQQDQIYGRIDMSMFYGWDEDND